MVDNINHSNEVLTEESVSIGEEIVRFFNQTRGLAGTYPFLVAIANLGVQAARTHQKKFLDKHAKKIDTDQKNLAYRVPIDHISQNEKLKNLVFRVQHGSESIPKFFLVSLISEFDFYLGRLIRWYLQKVPSALESSDKKLSFSDLNEFENLQEVFEFMIEKEIEGVLRRSHLDQFKWLENKLGITLTKDLPSFPVFIEICERRNLFVHSDGVVGHQYLKVCTENRCYLDEGIQVGKQLNVDPKYFSAAVNCLIEIGVKLGQVIWRKIDPASLDNADEILIKVAYELIDTEKYELAKVILDFGVNVLPKHGSENNRRILLVNLAQTYKWMGNEKQCKAILDSEDWTASSPEFRVCVAVLKDDFEMASKIMISIGKDNSPGEIGYKIWPIFKEFRKSEVFQKTFKEIYGKEHDDLKVEHDEDEVEREKLLKAFDLDEFIESIYDKNSS